MTVTVFGVIWILLLLYAFYERGFKLLIYLLLFSAVLQCDNVFLIGNSVGIGPQIITSMVFVFKTYFIQHDSHKIYLNSRILILTIPWVLLLIIIFVSSYKNKVFNLGGLRILQLFFYIWCYIRMMKIYKVQKNVDVNIIYRHLMWFVVICGGIQFVMSIGLIPKFKFFSLLLYNESFNYSVFFYNTNVKRLFSTFMEASYCSPFLVGSFYFLLYDQLNHRNRKYDMLLLCIIFTEIVLTFSATAYATLAIGGCIFIMILKQNYTILKIVLIITLIFTILILYSKLEEIIHNKLESGSGVARFYLNRRGFNDYLSSPFIGVGFKNSRSSSLIMTILGELGGIGFLTYIICILSNLKIFLHKNRLEIKKYFLILMCALIAQIISIPDLEFCVFWLFMNISAMAFSKYLYLDRIKNDIDEER